MKTKLLIFGITGDLSTRKLLPALEQIIGTGNFNELSVIGISRHDVNKENLFIKCLNKSFLDNKLSLFSMDLGLSSDYARLKRYINLEPQEQLLVYMAVPPMATAEIIELMGVNGINSQNVKILFEKPFGIDLGSANSLINGTAKYYKEEQIYRIDHYLAKEMAQNIVAFRDRNALFSDIWNNKFIESIEIIASQQMGIEGRAQFYEQTGALRDVVQGHLMQLLMLTLMEIPKNFEWDQMPKLRLDALSQLQLVDPNSVIRGQYDGYKNEVNNPNSSVETFISMNLRSAQDRWLGVPITLTTGKSLSETKTEIRIRLKSINDAKSNCLIFRIQPNEGIDIELFMKKPGYSREFETHHLNFNYSAETKLPDAYEQVIVDAISSQKSLFTSSDEVIKSWQILQPLQDAWIGSSESLKIYPIGSSVRDVLG